MEDSNIADPATAQKTADSVAPAPTNEVAELKSEVAKLQNSLARLIRLSSEGKSKTDDPPQPKKGVDEELKQRLDKIDKRAAITAKNATRQAARAAFLDAGIASHVIEDVVELFLSRHGSQASYDDETDTVLVRSSEIDDPLSVKDFIAQQAKSGVYNYYKAAKATPTKGGAGQPGKTSNGRIQMTLQEYAAASRLGGLDHTKIDITG